MASAESCIFASISRRSRFNPSSFVAMGAAVVAREQALDAGGHVLQPSGRVEPRSHGEGEVGRDDAARVAARHGEQRGHAR
jgi:hypothetical protein